MSEYIIPPPSTLPPGSTVIDYMRDSGGPNQDESIGQQERVITDYCKKYGLVLTQSYSETASGRKTKNRDQFIKMFDTVMTSPNQLLPRGLLLWSYSRFSRDIVDFNYYLYGLIKRGLIVHSLTEAIPEGIAGQIMLSVKAYTNADYSIQLGNNIKRGIADRVTAGYSNGGLPPKGYLIERDNIGYRRNGLVRTGIKWIVDPDIAPLIRLAWEMRSQGKGYTEIIKATGGIVYTNKGSWITHFKNKSYLGIGKAGDLEIPDHHEPLITWELWEAVRKVEKERDTLYHYKRFRYPSLLSGYSFCIYCGAAMVLHTSKDYRCYTCGKRDRQRGYQDCTEARKVNAPKVERLILDAVFNRILSSSFAEELLSDIQKQMVDTDGIDREVGKANNLLINTDKTIVRLLRLAEGTGDIEEIASRLIDLKREKSELELQIKKLKAQRDIVTPQVSLDAIELVFAELRKQIQNAVQSGEILTAKKLISQFVQKIELSHKNAIIHYTYPLAIQAVSEPRLSAHKDDR